MTSALDTLEDPLLTPLLALVRDAINADVLELVDADATAEPAVANVAPHPVPIEIAGETTLPLLTCYRVRSRARRRSIAFVDHTYTLQFAYVTPATPREQIPQRWPLLEQAWASLLEALSTGAHAAHREGQDVLCELGVIDVPLASAQKRELFYDGGDYAYPSFLAEIDLVVQDDSMLDTSALHPALSFETGIYIGDVSAESPDVSVISYTPEGEPA